MQSTLGCPVAKTAFFFRTHFWDAFAARMAESAAAQFGEKDFFVSADYTNGSFSCGDFEVVSHTIGDLESNGLPNRPSVRTMWYNADYAFIDAALQKPEYDTFVFFEYDVKFNIDKSSFIDRLCSNKVDLFAPNFARVDSTWEHYASTCNYYDNVFRILPVFTVLSKRLIERLYERRKEMGLTIGPDMAWPYCESFIASEAIASGYIVDPMLDFFLTRHCRFAPPMPEEEAGNLLNNEIRHPVLSQERFKRSQPSRFSDWTKHGRNRLKWFRDELKGTASKG